MFPYKRGVSENMYGSGEIHAITITHSEFLSPPTRWRGMDTSNPFILGVKFM